MLAKIRSFALVGIEAVPVEVDSSAGLPKTILVGLAETSVKGRACIALSGLANLGFERPSGWVIINLAPITPAS